MSTVPRWAFPAVFLDRDGTIIEDVGYVRDPSQVVFFDNTVHALALLAARFRLFIVTNQTGIAEGALTHAEVDQVNEFIVIYLARFGVPVERVYCCPHRLSDGCQCIKPNTFFPEAAALQYGIDLRRSFVIGDHPHDMQLAHNAGARGVYVLTGHGSKHLADLQTFCDVTRDIWQAAEVISQTVSHLRHLRRDE